MPEIRNLITGIEERFRIWNLRFQAEPKQNLEMSSRVSEVHTRGKSILIQVHRCADPAEEESCIAEESRLLGRKPTFHYADDTDQTEAEPVETNSWLLIKDTSTNEPKISKIFDGIPQDKPIHCRCKTGCVIVDSHLYDIAGCGNTRATMFHMSNQIRSLDCKNPDQGWKSEDLSIYCANPITLFYNNLIYMFPGGPRFTKIGELANVGASPPCPWAYVYDTIKHEGYHLDLPPNCRRSRPYFCASMEVRGVLVSIVGEDDKMKLYMHKTDEWVWEKIDYHENNKDSLSECYYNKQYAVSNGILYVYGTSVLYCYKISPWSFIGRIKLPEFDYDFDDGLELFIVPVADFELCFLWYEDESEKAGHLHYAKISVSFEPPAPTATLLREDVFSINANGVINCIPYDYDQNGEEEDDCLHSSETEVKERSHVTNKRKNQECEEVEWKMRCVNLLEELRRKDEEIQRLGSLLPKH